MLYGGGRERRKEGGREGDVQRGMLMALESLVLVPEAAVLP